MKKYCFAFFLFVKIFCHSQNIPNSLYGIWEAQDRYVFFEKSGGQNGAENQIAIYLKTYYGWYVDRSAEPAEYSEKEPRTRNSATGKNAEHIFFTAEKLRNSEESGNEVGIEGNGESGNGIENAENFLDGDCVFEINLKYSKNDYAKIPVAIVKNNMYLNFFVRDEENQNFYKGNAASEGLKISARKTPQNIRCLYFYENFFFDIRYWLTDADFENAKVSFDYGGNVFFASKHIFSAGNNYSCVPGRAKKIRNVAPPFIFEKDENSDFFYYDYAAYAEKNIENQNRGGGQNLIAQNGQNQNGAQNQNEQTEQNPTAQNRGGQNGQTFFFNEDKSVLVFDKSPYLVKLLDKNTFEDLAEITKKTNSQRKPELASLFPPNNLDWHWDLIDYIEKNDKIIQEVRRRQKEFGARAKDFEKSDGK